jgi:hypothetical protein
MFAMPETLSPPSAMAMLGNAVAAKAPATQADTSPADLSPAVHTCILIQLLHAGTQRELFEHLRHQLDAGTGIREGCPRRA